MRYLLVFFTSLLFILLPTAKADVPVMTYFINFTESSNSQLYQNLQYYNSEGSCDYDYCTQSTISASLNSLVDKLENAGYTFYLRTSNTADTIYLFVVDTSHTYDDLTLFTKEQVSTNSSVLSYYLSTSEQDVGTDSNLYGWTFTNYGSSNIVYDDVVGTISSTPSSNLGTIELMQLVFPDDNPQDFTVNLRNYYTNLKYNYSISPYELEVFTDREWNGSKQSYILKTGTGFYYNRVLMYYWYLNNYTLDGVEGIPGEKPDDTPEDSTNQDIVDGLGDLNNSINSTDTSGSEGAFNDFFGNFESDDHGLFAIVSTPLNFIKSFLNSVCTPLVLPLPFVNTDVTLPCMEYVYREFFGNFFSAYQLITTGIVAYWVCINILRIVKDMKDSEKDTIEVLDL